MTCTCGHHEHAHAQDVGMCGSPHGCDCNKFHKAPAVHDGLSMDGVHHHKAKQDAEWLAGSEADTAERNLARAYLALKDEVAGFEAMWEQREKAHDVELAEARAGGSVRETIDRARTPQPDRTERVLDILSDGWWEREVLPRMVES